eukprot:gene57021-76133_t
MSESRNRQPCEVVAGVQLLWKRQLVARWPNARLGLEGHSLTIANVKWSPDGTLLASGSYDGELKLWDVTSGALLGTLKLDGERVTSIAWSPDGRKLASGRQDGTVQLWVANSGKLLRTFEGHTGSVTGITWSSDGEMLASGSLDRTIKLWSVNSGDVLNTLEDGF